MNRTTLKTKWGKYTDTDALVDKITDLYAANRHRHTTSGICTMLDTYFTNKEPLIKMIQKSPNYAGDLRIIINKEFARDNSARDINNFCRGFINNVEANKILLKRMDDDGKTIVDYIKSGKQYLTPKQLHTAKLKKIDLSTTPFCDDGHTRKSLNEYNNFDRFMTYFSHITESSISEGSASGIKAIDSNMKVAKGMKTSRAFNHICAVYGVDKASSYNKRFAEYADMVSGLMRSLDFIISLNPYDYLTMSVGKSWTSCHHIYTGGYKGGTLSYMLDKTSIITFVIDKGGNPYDEGKIYRNMFHFKGNTLIQARVYKSVAPSFP